MFLIYIYISSFKLEIVLAIPALKEWKIAANNTAAI